MAQIFLCGGAETQVKELDRKFAEATLHAETKRLLYLPVAHPEMVINGVEYTHDRMFAAMKHYFAGLGVADVEMWKTLQGRTYDELARFGAVYISGGNTFSLMKQVRDSGFDKVLSRYIDEDGIVYGSSAGAVILGRDIGTANFGEDPDENRVGLKSPECLDKVSGYAILCHHKNSEDGAVMEYSVKNGFGVIAIESRVGIVISDGRAEVVKGDGNVYLFEDGRKSTVGKELFLRRP